MSKTTLNINDQFRGQFRDDLNLSDISSLRDFFGFFRNYFDRSKETFSQDIYFFMKTLFQLGNNEGVFLDLQSNSFKQELAEIICSHFQLIELQKNINYTFDEPAILIELLTHKSFINEFENFPYPHYERLELLGDSVVGLIVTSHLFDEFVDLSEGDLSRFRSSLVNENSLAKLAKSLMIGDCLIVGKGELSSGAAEKEALLCDVVESLMGGVYRESGMNGALKVFNSILSRFEKETGQTFVQMDSFLNYDAKSKLQELTISTYKSLPLYKDYLLDDQHFLVELYIDNKKVLEQKHISKKQAQRMLASKALELDLVNNLKDGP